MTEQAPVERGGTGAHRDGKVYSHPAFGQLSVSRVQGRSTLYGSDFVHHNCIVLTIAESELHRDLSHDWHHPTQSLIEVAMSEAQWARMVANPNQGGGTPCTIQRVDGKRRPDIPVRDVRPVYEQEFRDRLAAAVAEIDKAIADVEGEIGTSLSGKRKSALLGRLESLRMQVRNNLPFIATSFGEHMEGVVEQAKVDVAAEVAAQVQRAGLAALGAEPMLQLPAGNQGEDR